LDRRDDLLAVLVRARDLGFLGPGPVEPHLDHAAGFAEALRVVVGGEWPVGPGDGGLGLRAADLGSGGGLPGLPMALLLPGSRWTLVDSASRRAGFLRDAVRALSLEERVDVAEERAEVFGRSEDHRGRYDLVVARSFGPPAVVSECAAPLLVVGGWAVVSEPPGGVPARWPSDGLAMLGMAPEPAVTAGGWAYQVLRQVEPCPDRYPRRVGIPAKRPLF
jgi:16S rRNA (guanine527-N7)-methyltransferase